MTIKKIVFALGVLALGFTATAPAHADYAIVSFHSGYCRIWTYTDVVPPDGAFVWFVWGHHRYNRLPTLASPSISCIPSSHGACAGTTEASCSSASLSLKGWFQRE